MAAGIDEADGRSPSELERQTEIARANVERTLEELENRLSPTQLMEQAAGYVRGSGGAEFARNVGRTVMDNPMPLALMGLAMGWLFVSDRKRDRDAKEVSAHATARRPLSSGPEPHGYSGSAFGAASAGAAQTPSESQRNPYEGRGDFEVSAGNSGAPGGAARPDARDRVSPAMEHGKDRMSEGMNEVSERAKAGVRDLGERAAEMGEAAAHAASEARERAEALAATTRERSARMMSTASRSISRVRDQSTQRFRTAMQEQPLALGAISFAVGAIIGAALPSTRREDELMGDARDRALEGAQEVGREQVEKARTVAESAMEAAREEVRHGIDDAKQAAARLKEDVKSAATAAGDAAAREARHQESGSSAGPGSAGARVGASGSGAAPAKDDLSAGMSPGTSGRASSAGSSTPKSGTSAGSAASGGSTAPAGATGATGSGTGKPATPGATQAEATQPPGKKQPI